MNKMSQIQTSDQKYVYTAMTQIIQADGYDGDYEGEWKIKILQQRYPDGEYNAIYTARYRFKTIDQILEIEGNIDLKSDGEIPDNWELVKKY